MDWIPRPLHVALPFEEVPCLNTQGYDHGEWKSYPERQGFHARTFNQWTDFFSAENLPHGFDAFVERWLFWGA
ncbi:hypothetical protein OIDMADRAFT_16596, partial [Oidiodendron maius Zn]